MKLKSNIVDDYDIVNKKYVDNKVREIKYVDCNGVDNLNTLHWTPRLTTTIISRITEYLDNGYDVHIVGKSSSNVIFFESKVIRFIRERTTTSANFGKIISFMIEGGLGSIEYYLENDVWNTREYFRDYRINLGTGTEGTLTDITAIQTLKMLCDMGASPTLIVGNAPYKYSRFDMGIHLFNNMCIMSTSLRIVYNEIHIDLVSYSSRAPWTIVSRDF